MKMRLKLGWVLIGALVFSAHPAGAAILLLGGSGGTNTEPEPSEGAQTEENWNPTVTCDVEEGDTIWDLLQCLLDSISNPPPPCVGEEETPGEDDPFGEEDGSQEIEEGGGQDEDCSNPLDRDDFTVTLLPDAPPYGLEILTLDGLEIERISLWENDPGIQTTELRLEQPDRFVRIGEIVEQPSGSGLILVTLNKDVVRIATANHLTSIELNAALIAGIRALGYAVTYEPPYLVVSVESLGFKQPLTRVQFRSTDPAIVRSDIGIFPLERSE